MHELSIVQAMLEAAVETASTHRANQIRRIDFRVGCLRQIDAGLLREAFEVARVGTSAANATLAVTAVGMRLNCRACGFNAEIPGWRFDCPACASGDVELSGGEELELTSLELEVPDED